MRSNLGLFKVLMTLFVTVALFGCQSTQKASDDAGNSKTNRVKFESEYATKYRLATELVEKLNAEKREYDFAEWDLIKIQEDAERQDNGLAASMLSTYAKGIKTRFANVQDSSSLWLFNGVREDKIYLSCLFNNNPIGVILKVNLIDKERHARLSIVDFKLMNHMAFASQVFLLYLNNEAELKALGYFNLLNGIRKGNVSEADILAMLDKLPAKYANNGIILNELLFRSISMLGTPSVEFMDKAFAFLAEPNANNAGLWVQYYLVMKDFESLKSLIELMDADVDQMITYTTLRHVLYGLELGEFGFSQQKFMDIVRTYPNDVFSYVAYLFALVEKEQYQDAAHLMVALRKQFQIELSSEDFEDLDTEKVSAFFASEAYRTLH